MSIFFVTGLPRSRTTWLSVLLTYAGSYCLHDESANGLDAMEKKMVDTLTQNPHIGHVGNSDSGLLLVAGQIVKRLPNARWLFVNRDRASCEASYRIQFAEYDPYVPAGTDISKAFDICEAKYQEALHSVPQKMRMEIDVADLDRLEHIRAIVEYLTPGELFCEDRAKMLDKFQINPFAKKLQPFYSK